MKQNVIQIKKKKSNFRKYTITITHLCNYIEIENPVSKNTQYE